MLKEQRRTQDLEARKQLIFAIQRYAADQQYYVYLHSAMFTGSWQPYVKNYAPNHSYDFGNRAAALWLDRWDQAWRLGRRCHARMMNRVGIRQVAP